MKRRCEDVKNNRYASYGGRGIRVTKEWQDFRVFIHDMGPLPGPGYSIERIDNDDHYRPENCKWILKIDQAKNRRANRRITIAGTQFNSLDEAARSFELPRSTFKNRIDLLGWKSELTKPAISGRNQFGDPPLYTHQGVSRTLQQWADHVGLLYFTLRRRIKHYKWTLDKALSTPVRVKKS